MRGIGPRRRSKKRKRKHKQAMVELPDEILFRLPVKSLLKFKMVSKSWYSIIKSKHFVKKHLNHAHSTLYDQHKDFLGILRIPNSSDDSTRCILYNQNSNGIIYAKEFDLPFKLVEVCNYCDGLICFNILSEHDDILVWNPSLPNEYNIVPMKYKTKKYDFFVGIGYDSTTDDYKIVGVPEFSWNVNSSKTSFVKVFSLKSRSWSKKEISKNFPYEIYENMSTIYTRNRLHWIGKYYDDVDTIESSIIYFDMVEERLDVVNLPCELGEMFNYKDTLAIKDYETLWVLEEYNGMKSSWSKFEYPEFKYCADTKRRTNGFSYHCFTRDGKILITPCTVYRDRSLSVRHGLRTYDPKDGNVMNVEIQGDNGIMYKKATVGGKFHASSYVESLVSPKWFE